MEKNKITILNESGCLTRDAIIAFLGRKLSSADKFFVDKHLQECALCRDSLEGLGSLTPEQLRKNFADINFRMQNRLVSTSFTSKTISRRMKVSLAAAIFFALIGIFSIFKYLDINKSRTTVSEDLLNHTLTQKEPAPASEPVVSPEPQQSESRVERQGNTKLPEVEKPVSTKKSAQKEVQALVIASEENKPEVTDVSSEVKEELAVNTQEMETIAAPTQAPALAQRSREVAAKRVRFAEKSISVEAESNDEATFYAVDKPASFNGGDITRFKTWVEEKLKASAANQNLSHGNLTLSFSIDKTGVVKDVYVVKGLDAKTDSTATAIVKNSPKWIPAKNQGQAVKVNMVLPLEIK